jgi:regulator of replication initiation timing
MSIVVFIPILIAILVLLLFMIFYPRYYKQKINKDLQKGKAIKVIEPVYLYGGLMFVILLISIIITNTSMSRMEERLSSNFNNQITTLEFDQERTLKALWDLQERLGRLEEENSYIRIFDINVTGKTSETDTYQVLIDFALTEQTEGLSSTLVFDGEEDVRLPLEEDQLRQNLTLELDLYQDYLIYLEVEDGIETRVQDIQAFNLFDYLRDRFTLLIDFDNQVNTVTITYDLINEWENTDHPDIKIDQVDVSIVFNGDLMVEETFTTPNVFSSHYQEFMGHYQFDVKSTSGTWQFLLTVTDEFGIVYDNLLYD